MIGKNLKKYRSLIGLSQKELAEKAGFSKEDIIKFENDEKDVDSKTLIKLADALAIKATCLLFRE